MKELWSDFSAEQLPEWSNTLGTSTRRVLKKSKAIAGEKMGFLSVMIGFVKNKKWFLYSVVGLVVFGAVYYVWHNYTSLKLDLSNARQRVFEYEMMINHQQAQIEQLKHLNSENEKQMDVLKKQYEYDIIKLKQKYEEDLKNNKQIIYIKQRIKDVNKSDDGPAAPVLRDTFDWLRRMQTAPAENNNSNQNGS